MVNIVVQPGNFSGTDNGEFIICGHVGAAGLLTTKEEKMVRIMLILDTVRGEDSTGVAIIPQNGEVVVAKELGNPFELFESRRYIAGMRKANRVIIGHNRYATSGGVSRHTAHPFEFDTLVGCHNGTLTNKHALLDERDFKVDSENLYHQMEVEGLKSVLGVMQGAWALVWWDKVKETLNFLRNEERSFFTAASKNSKALFWASEEWMLRIAAGRAGVELGDVSATPIDTHFSIPVSRTGELFKPTVHVYPYVKPPVITYFNNYVSPATVVRQVAPPLPLVPPVTTVLDKKKLDSKTYEKNLQSYYVDRKDLILEITGVSRDQNGGRYVMMLDPLMPQATIRMYYNKESDPVVTLIGCEVLCEVAGVNYINGNINFIRINPHTYELVDQAVTSTYTGTEVYETGLGTFVTKAEWEAYHKNCDWCFEILDADSKGNMLAPNGQCFCGVCASDPVKTEGMKLKSVC